MRSVQVGSQAVVLLRALAELLLLLAQARFCVGALFRGRARRLLLAGHRLLRRLELEFERGDPVAGRHTVAFERRDRGADRGQVLFHLGRASRCRRELVFEFAGPNGSVPLCLAQRLCRLPFDGDLLLRGSQLLFQGADTLQRVGAFDGAPLGNRACLHDLRLGLGDLPFQPREPAVEVAAGRAFGLEQLGLLACGLQDSVLLGFEQVELLLGGVELLAQLGGTLPLGFDCGEVARVGLEDRGFAVIPDLQAGTGGGRLRLGRGQPGQLDDEARERGGARRVGQRGIELGKPGVDGGTQRIELTLCRFEQMDVS